MRDDPSLRGRPLAVGGRADQRGVVATCNYEARRFGIHSAMATAQAMKLCPELLVIPPAMEKYRIASRQIMEIYADYTDLVEPLSLDEAYLDVSNSPHCKGSATLIAQEIRRRIFETVGITASAGVAPNKFVALSRVSCKEPIDRLHVAQPMRRLHMLYGWKSTVQRRSSRCVIGTLSKEAEQHERAPGLEATAGEVAKCRH
jgi:DNA polymerase-4